MNIYKELFQNWIPDCPEQLSENYQGLWGFYTSFYTDYGPVFTIASYILIYTGIAMICAMFMWGKWADFAAKSVQFGCGLWLAYLLSAAFMAYSNSPLLNNNATGMLSRMFISMAIHIPLWIVLMCLTAAIAPREWGYGDSHEERMWRLRKIAQSEHDYINRKK